eukprot:TRINITY_DN6460_c0_g1_i8.p1 TRINITY_DN6460_c0_g1~~TRINITY_DN6460_c0_g1_i8.p1  ORF type:complete len:280 (+),score=64.76 TRINITY_DN6460_c0_g1_i8:66-842(+)
MKEDMCRFYAAEILFGLEELHSLGIVYRDLKPDNVLFHESGHLRISDYGVSVQLTPSHPVTSGRAGTAGYQAPEVLNRHKYSYSADVWSFGVTIYELLHNRLPFGDSADFERPLEFAKSLSKECQSFIRHLLVVDVKHRLGCGPRGWNEVKEHPWFAGLDWERMARQEIPAPHQPDLEKANCSNKFSLEDEMASFQSGGDEKSSISPEQQALFKGFNFKDVINPPVGMAPAPVVSPHGAPQASAPLPYSSIREEKVDS